MVENSFKNTFVETVKQTIMGSGLFGTSTVPTMGAPQGTTSGSDRRLQARGDIWEWSSPTGRGDKADIWEWSSPTCRGTARPTSGSGRCLSAGEARPTSGSGCRLQAAGGQGQHLRYIKKTGHTKKESFGFLHLLVIFYIYFLSLFITGFVCIHYCVH